MSFSQRLAISVRAHAHTMNGVGVVLFCSQEFAACLMEFVLSGEVTASAARRTVAGVIDKDRRRGGGGYYTLLDLQVAFRRLGLETVGAQTWKHIENRVFGELLAAAGAVEAV